jgi:hypothetical protein
LENTPNNCLDIAWDWFAPLVLLLAAVRGMLSLRSCRIGYGAFWPAFSHSSVHLRNQPFYVFAVVLIARENEAIQPAI